MMKNILFSLMTCVTTMTASLSATQAVVFDWGNVIGFDDRSVVVKFMCDSFHISEPEFESANLEKRKATKAGKSDVEFWIEFAKKNGVQLPKDWAEKYIATLKGSVGADPEMYMIVDQLKKKGIRVGMLSNINDRYTKLIRDFGFYEPFDPCLLSCEMGLEKPDPKAYELLLNTMKLPAEEVVFIDDKAENVDAAKKMGIDAIVFESSQQIREELVKREILSK
jgi:epoxide hydrolase-like predicted phosphatase